MRKWFFTSYRPRPWTKTVRHLSALIVSFLLLLAPQAAMARDFVYRCERLFGSTPFNELRRVKILKTGRAKTFQLKPGQQISIENGSSEQQLYYIGREVRNGKNTLVFVQEYNMHSFIHIDASHIENFAKLSFREDDQLVQPTDQAQTPTCAAHAAGACVVAHTQALKSTELNANDPRSIDRQRALLIQEAIGSIYGNNEGNIVFDQKVQGFLNAKGLDSRSFLVDGENNQNQLYELLKANHPVYLGFRSKRESYYRSHELVGEISRRFSDFSNPPNFHTRSFSNYERAQRHAVVLLKTFEIGGSKAVLALDSSIGEFRIWWWNDIVNASVREPHIVIVPDQKEEKSIAEIPAQTLDSLKNHQSRSEIADFILKNPQWVRQVDNKEAWFQQPVIGQWVVISMHPGSFTGGSGSDVIVGRVSRIGTGNDGTPYVEYQPFSYNRLGKHLDPKSFGGSVAYLWKTSLYKVKDIHILDNQGQKFFQTLQQSRPAQIVAMDWSEFPHSKPMRVRGPILSITAEKVKIFDEKTQKVIELSPGDFVSNLKVQNTKNPEKELERFTQALKTVLMERHRSEGYNSDWVDSIKEFERDLQKSNLVFFPSPQSPLFDVSKIPSGSRAIVFLTEDFRLYGEGDRTRRSTIGQISDVEVDSFTFEFGYRTRLKLVPQNIAAIFIFP